MSRRPPTIAEVLAKKKNVAIYSDPNPPAAAPTNETRTLTLRLPELVHDQLREMAFTSRKSQHALLLEALNLLFVRYDKPPIAPGPS